jgi:hypothetical protein
MSVETRNASVSAWAPEELRAISEADDLHIAPFREDRKTTGTPTWIWNVAVDGNLYVRAYSGSGSSWYRAAVRQRAGKIEAAGQTRNVAFEPVDGPMNNRINEAYRAKYAGSPYLGAMVCDRARAATVKILPRRED